MRKKDIVTTCMLSLLSFVSCDMNLLDRLIGTISEKFSEEEYYAGLRRRRQEQSDVALKSGKKFKKKNNRIKREIIELAGRGDNNKNITEDVKDLQSVLSSPKVSALRLPQEQQNNALDNVVPKSIRTGGVSNQDFDLENKKNRSFEGSENLEMIQQDPEQKTLLPTESVIESQSVVVSQSESGDSYLHQSEDTLIQEAKEINQEIRHKIDSALTQMDTLHTSFKAKLSELDNFESEIANTKAKAVNFDINLKQIVEQISNKINAGKLLSLDQILDQASRKTQESINVARALYQKKIDILVKTKVNAEEAKSYIDSDDIEKVKNGLSNAESVIQGIYTDLKSIVASRNQANKELSVFKEFIVMRLEKFDSIIKAGSYDKVDNKFKYVGRYLERLSVDKNDKEALYTILKRDHEINIDKFLYDNAKYLLGS